MKNKELQTLLYAAARRLPTSAVIVVRILADTNLQRILKKGGTGRPILIIYGEPGNGKTSSVQALLDECFSIKFADGFKAVKKAVAEMLDMVKVQILFLDNFPQSLSPYKLETAKRILDYVIDIISENLAAPMTIITGEPNIIEEVKKAKYLVGRSLVVRMSKIDEDEELYNIRKHFSMNRTEYLEHWRAFDRWAEQNPADEEEALRELEDFRSRYCGKYENRQVGLVFCYFYAMCRYSKFLKSEYGQSIDMEDIRDNVQTLFEWEKTPVNSRPSFEVDVWNEFVKDGGICKVTVPDDSVCPLLVRANCDCYGALYQCHMCQGENSIKSYNPMDLRLPEDSDGAVLIEKPGLIPDFPRHVVCNEPILMIRNTSLLEMLNTYLEAYSRKKDISVRRITPKRLTKELFSHNLCLFEYVGVGHNTYTFRMKDTDNKDVRVIFIKLTMAQYHQLKSRVKKNFKIENYSVEDVYDMKKCLKYFCENVQSLIGDAGKPSVVLEDINQSKALSGMAD